MGIRTGLAIALAGCLVAGCGAAAAPSAAPSTAPSAAVTSVVPATVVPTRTVGSLAAAPTVSGFDGWSANKPLSVAVTSEDGSLVLRLTHQALWFNAERGVLFSKPTHGDIRITATVRVARSSDPSAAPGGAGTAQLAGVMIRADRSPEDDAFIVIGDDGDGLSVETKSTDDSVSVYEGPRWQGTAADLRLCRVGATVTLYKRTAGSNAAWTLAAIYDRPDLPESPQAGANIYSSGAPDITARFDHLVVEPVAGAAGCPVD